MARARSAPLKEDTRTLLVKSRGEGTFKITIPADWKVTFSAFQQGRGYDGQNALRIYEAEKQQRACFIGVESFRDLGIPITRLVKSQSGEQTWQDDGEGNTQQTKKVKTQIREVPA